MDRAMSHQNRLGKGAAKRRKLPLRRPEKMGVVMGEYKRGTLHSGSGGIVRKRKQAIAIAMSEARKGWEGRHD